jgi:hypothetical protein
MDQEMTDGPRPLDARSKDLTDLLWHLARAELNARDRAADKKTWSYARHNHRAAAYTHAAQLVQGVLVHDYDPRDDPAWIYRRTP